MNAQIATIDSDDLRADGLPLITEVFNDRAQAVRRAARLGWTVLPQCPHSGKHGVCHPTFLPAWRQKVNARRRSCGAALKAKDKSGLVSVPYSPIAYGF